MKKTELLSEIQAMVFALKEDADQIDTPFLKKIKQRKNRIDLSVLVRIRQKKTIDEDIFLILVKETEEEVSTLKLTSMTLNPKNIDRKEGDYASKESGHRLKEDEYAIMQNIQFNLTNIPLRGVGLYALALVSEKGDLNSLIDAYYFTVE